MILEKVKNYLSGFSKRTFIYIAMFVFSLHMGLTSFVNSTLLSDVLGFSQGNVGYIFTGAALFLLTLFALIPKALSRFAVKRILVSSALTHAIAALLLSLVTSSLWGLIIFLVYYASGVITLFLGDIMVEHYTKDAETGKVRGAYLTVQNTAWVIAPFISGLIIGQIGLAGVYRIGLFLSIAVGIFALVTFEYFDYQPKNLEKKNQKTEDSEDLKELSESLEKSRESKSLKAFFRNKDLRTIFFSQILLNIFYAVMVVYSPIYLNQTIGISWTYIGFIFSIMLLAFPLFQIPLGRIADAKYGEREILGIGFLIISIMTLLVGLGVTLFASSPWWVWAIVFFGTRAGASAVEIMNESYFFKHVDDTQIEFISIYRNAFPLSYVIAPLLVSLLLATTNISYSSLFIGLGVIVLAGVGVSFTLRDTK